MGSLVLFKCKPNVLLENKAHFKKSLFLITEWKIITDVKNQYRPNHCVIMDWFCSQMQWKRAGDL